MRCPIALRPSRTFTGPIVSRRAGLSGKHQAGPDSRRGTLQVVFSASQVNVLLVGGGGREHALAWKFGQSPRCQTLFCAPGNPGIAQEAKVTLAPDLDLGDHAAVTEFCRANAVELVMVGPEAPLVDGLVDSLEAAGVSAFGPTAAAAQLEGSKKFMKDLCAKYDIPTAFYGVFTDVDSAKEYVRTHGAPIVVKASGLAAGKGVVVAQSEAEAFTAIEDMLQGGIFGSAGSEIVVEEYLDGEEASYFAIIDGGRVLALASAQDHKAVGEGDVGPMTGGMGAYSPAPVVTPDLEAQVLKDIVQATADAMVAEGAPFRGILFAGLMIKDGRAKLLEHNVRFGDPECQGLMMRLESDLLDVLLAACDGALPSGPLEWSDQTALTVVLAAQGYPGAYEKGSVIRGLEGVATAKVFHAGTASGEGGEVLAVGGRVLGVTALGASVREAQERAYAGVDCVDWPEGFHRKDIGWRAVDRA